MALLNPNTTPRRQESDARPKYPRLYGPRERNLIASVINDRSLDENFAQALVVSATAQDGAAYTGTTGQVIGLSSGRAVYEVYQAAVDTPAVVAPFQSVDGLELKPVAAADALELTLGTTANCKYARTVGSLPTPKGMYLEIKCKIDDISDLTEAFIGLRKAEAYRADPNDYDEMASFHIGASDDGRISIKTILNNAATATTDTTLADFADGEEHTFRIEVQNSGVVSFLYDGATPTVTAAFTFDAGEVIVPFIHANTETGDPGISISILRVGDL